MENKEEANQNENTENIDEGYSDLLLVDLLNLDFKHFFTRYKTDFFGFCAVLSVIFLMILSVILLAKIGA